MSQVLITKNKIDTLANSIAAKSGEGLPMTLDEMKTAVDNINSGGVTPTGNINITSSGVTDVTNYATATVPAAAVTSQNIALDGDAFVIGISNSGLVTADVLANYTINPISSDGYIETTDTVSGGVSGRTTYQITTQAAKTVTPSTSSQTAVVANRYTTGAVTVAAMPTGTAGTPTATKGNVSNHAITVTPSVTNTTGYITGSTKTGTAVTVSASELVSGSLSITSNNTYDVTNYASAVVNVSGGSSSWTKIAETTYTVNTSSTSAATVGTWSTGNSSIWTSDSFVYVRIRDTAGKRAGYFYGSDTFFTNYIPVNSSTTTSLTAGTFGMTYRYSNPNTYASRYNYGTTGYGVYADTIYSDGRIRIRSRYNNSYSSTINGTYKVEAYVLTTPDGVSIFT